MLHPATESGTGLTDEEATVIEQLIAKRSCFSINLASDDLDADFERIAGLGAEVVQEPINQDYGVRDAAFHDPAGNLIRMQQKG